MTRTAPTRRQSVAARRAGYVIAIVINATLLYVVNVWPGWQAVSFLTEDTRQVLGLVNLSLAAGVVANVAYLAHDGPLLKALGDLVTTGIGLAAVVRVWQVFPFDFRGWSYDWSFLVHVLLMVGIVEATKICRYVGSGRPQPRRTTSMRASASSSSSEVRARLRRPWAYEPSNTRWLTRSGWRTA